MKKTIGLISDTHGVLKQKAMDYLSKSDLIIHGGDVGDIKILDSLKEIAPVYCVKGNIDKGELKGILPLTQLIHLDKITIYVIHNLKEIDIDPKAEGIDIVISGHSHKFSKHYKDGVLYVNPGGAGRKRFNLPLTVGILYIWDNKIDVEFQHL